MSFPNQVLRGTEELSVNFLSAQTYSALNHALQKQDLSAPERLTLENAATFLEQIADGAEFANRASTRFGSTPSRSIAALDMALGPLDALKEIVGENEELDSFFGGLAGAVRSLGASGHVSDNESQIQLAATFFELLRNWLASRISASRPRLGSHTGLLGLAG
jgi:hypothetical protein